MTKNYERPTKDIYQKITDSIVAKIEEGAGTFNMPWHSDGDVMRPVNIKSKLPYRGVNIVQLWVAAQEKSYDSNEWGTYAQWMGKGHPVKHGEKATSVVFWKFPESTDTEGDNAKGGDMPQGDRPGDRLSRRVLARGYAVFNAAQVENYTPPPVRVLPVSERVAHADEFFDSLDATIKHGGRRAFYSPLHDEIVLPKFEAFNNPLAYYAVRAHETAHWTGAASRLDRGLKDTFGTESYAKEELVAELTSAFICADLGLSLKPRQENAQYIASWLKALKDDPRAIFTAASAAQKSADYMHDRHVMRFAPEENYDQIGVTHRAGALKQAAYGPRL